MEQKAQGINLDDTTAKADQTIDCPLVFNEDGEPVVGLKLFDAHSEIFRKAKREADISNVLRSKQRAKGLDLKTRDGANQLLDMAEEGSRKFVLACTADWYGFNSNGQKSPLVKDKLEQLLAKYPIWVETAIARINESASFFEKPKTS